MTGRARPGGRRPIAAGVFAPAVTLGLLFLFWRLGQKWLAILVVVLVILFYLLLPRLIRARLARFHKQSLLLISSGRAAEVPGLARRSLLLQIFAPSAPIDAKIGLALAQIGDHSRAAPHLESALPAAPVGERPALQAALVKALFVTGDPARAETEGLELLDAGVRLPEVLAIMARSRVGLSRIDDRTRSLLDEAERSATSDDILLMTALTRIEIALAAGGAPPEIPAGADSSQAFLRAWIHLVRGRLREHRGGPAAAESYGRAVREDGDHSSWFSIMARERLEKLASAVDRETRDDTAAPTDIDPSIRRKRRKRR